MRKPRENEDPVAGLETLHTCLHPEGRHGERDGLYSVGLSPWQNRATPTWQLPFIEDHTKLCHWKNEFQWLARKVP